MSTNTTPITGIYAADPVHSGVGLAVKYMGVSTFRATLDTFTASDALLTEQVACTLA